MGERAIGDACTRFIRRVEERGVIGYTSPLVVDELAYKLLLKKVEEEFRASPFPQTLELKGSGEYTDKVNK